MDSRVIHGLCTFAYFDILGLIRDDGAMWRNILKFLGLAAVVVLIGIGVLWGVQYMRYRTSPEYRALEDLKNLEKQYAEDPYGGETPEETLRLFIDALKAGDTDLAAKYFVLDKQGKWKEDLVKIKERGLLDEMVKDADKLGAKYPLTKGVDDRFIFETYNESNELVMQADLGKGANGRWKILDL